MQYTLDYCPKNFEGLQLDPICRVACALLDVPGAVILIGDGRCRWSHVTDSEYRTLVDLVSLDNAPRESGQPLHWIEDARKTPNGQTIPVRFPATTPVAFVASIFFGPNDIATLVVFDKAPRILSPNQADCLADLAGLASKILDEYQDRHRLAFQLDFYRMLAEATTDTIVRGNLDGIRLYISPSIRELLGYDPEELIGKKAADLTHPDDLISLRAMMDKVRAGHVKVSAQELRQRHKDGHWVWMEASLRMTYDKTTGEPDGYVVSVRGIDKRKALEEKLERLAGYDELTGLPNRALLQKQLQKRLADGTGFALLYMDLDGFKLVNDKFGHGAGDAVLKETAQRLESNLRTGDVVARMGGDEFIALVQSDAKNIALLCERLIASAALPFCIGNLEAKISLSIGVACAIKDDMDVDVLLSRADRALYEAKNAGKNTFRFDMTVGPIGNFL